MYNLEFQSFLDAVEKGIQGPKSEFKKFIKINRNYAEIAVKIKSLISSDKNSLVVENGAPIIDDLNTKTIMAVDGGLFQEEYKRAIISFSSAFLYKNHLYEEKYMSKFNITTPDYFNITISILRQSLEFEIALKVLEEEIEKGQKPDLVLFDGTFTFPDDAVQKYIENKPEFQEILEEYKEIYSNYFKFSLMNNIPSIGVIKDSISNKFLKSFKNCVKKDYSNNFEFNNYFQINSDLKNEIIKLTSDTNFEKFSELTFIEQLFEDKINIRTKFIPIEEKFGIRYKLLFEGLNKNMIGFYARFGDSSCPIMFIEIPAQFITILNEITRILASFSTYSIIEGYPQPLYVAHKRAKMNYGKIFQRMNFLKYRLTDIDEKGAKNLFKKKLSFIKKYRI